MTKPQILRGLLLIAMVVVSLSATEYFMDKTMRLVKSGSVGKINAALSGEIDPTISIWGASTALVNFNTSLMAKKLNLSTFNFGIDGTNIDQYSGLLQEYISNSKKGKFVIIALDIPGGLSKRKSFYHFHNWIHHLDNDNIYQCLSTIDHRAISKARYIPYYKLILYDKHSFPIIRSTLQNDTQNYNFPNHGYSPRNILKFNTKNDTIMSLSIDVNETVFDKLTRACTMARENQMQPIVIITPIYQEGYAKLLNSNLFLTKIESLKKQKILVYDYSRHPITNIKSFFYDNTHLNMKGADSLTHILLRDLLEDSIFTE